MNTLINTKTRVVPSILQKVQDYKDLLKPGITTLVMVTALAGFYLGSSGTLNLPLLIHTLIGTGLVAGGGGALNHWMERDADARMKRTRNRPLPSGRMQPTQVLVFGIAVSFLGLLYLFVTVNDITTLLAVISWVSYVFIYTPMKRISPLATLFGAIPGALPPMGGWTAATGHIAYEAWILFAILFLWQLPHFLAIAWLCRKDYEQGGFPMLTVLQEVKQFTGYQMMLYSAGLLVVSLIPSAIGLTGELYLIGAFLIGLLFLGVNILMVISASNVNAKRSLWASLIYLPLLLVLMMADKIVL
ncbi:MAG TPA: heme o synthase [bacterium]|nr:heme o synthase [bacterium]